MVKIQPERGTSFAAAKHQFNHDSLPPSTLKLRPNRGVMAT